MLRIIDGLSIAQLNHIPHGFNNNLIWNLAHALVTQQILVYKFSGLPVNVPASWVDSFKKGSSPKDTFVDETAKNEIVHQLTKTIEILEADIQAGKFSQYEVYTTSFGLTLNDAHEAIQFNNIHEAMHLGYMMALKRVVLA